MTTSSTTVDLTSYSTDAKFRAWGLATQTAIVASGLTATADTGQINWASVSKPVATNTKAGYEIYRFNDSLQSTAPIFIRIDYGSGAVATGNSPSTWMTVGTYTDGAGNIGGVGMTVTQSQSVNSAPANSASLIMACTVAGYFFLGTGLNFNSASVNAGVWLVTRTCDSAGALTSEGVLIYGTGQSTPVVFSFTASFVPTPLRIDTGIAPNVSLLSLSSISSGSVVQLYKNYVNLGNLAYTQGVLTYRSGDISPGTSFTCSPWGVTHTYYALPSTVLQGIEPQNTANFLAAVIWE